MPIFWLDTKQDPAVEILATDTLSVGYVAAGTNLAWDFTSKSWRADGTDILKPMVKAGPAALATLWTASVDAPRRPATGTLAVIISHSRYGTIYLDESPIRPVVAGRGAAAGITVVNNITAS